MWAYEVCTLFYSALWGWFLNALAVLIRENSCSLGCTQSHKIYCEPKLESASESTTAAAAISESTQPPKKKNDHLPDLETLGTSPELHELFTRYPQLRSQLYDIYKTTLEEEWVEFQPQPGRGRGGNGRGRGGVRNRGQWTREKGFSRGLGKVKKSRERCEAGLDTGRDAEGFLRFVALVNPNDEEEENLES